MKVVVRRNGLETLEHQLQAEVQRQFPLRIPLQVRCALKQQTLIVLAQHQYEVSPNPWRAFEIFEQIIRQSHDELVRGAIALPKTLIVRFYLRIAGEDEPYAADGFDLYEGVESEQGQLVLASADASPLEEVHSELVEVSDVSAADLDSVLFQDSLGNQLSHRLPLRVLWVGAAVGVFALAGSLYALTRPCVVGGCAPLQTAQRLSQEAAQQVQFNSSAMDVSAAYQKLAEGSYLLGTIPRWSGEYAAAQTLLQAYEAESGDLEQMVAALQKANEAAYASQNPPHPLDRWEEIRGLWEEAIALLEKVSTDRPVHPLAQQKLTEYQANLSMINQRIGVEQQAQDKIKLARETARLAEAREGVADSAESWRLTHVTWQVVVNLLQQIPQGTMVHAEAGQLLAIYQPRLEDAGDRRMQEEISANAYSQAVTMAAAARSLEQQNQWSQAIRQWRNALDTAQQVPTGTTYHNQVQPLINSYTTSLSGAQETLRSTVAIGDAQAQLEQTCAGNLRVCTFTLANEVIQVRITPDYDQAVEQAMATSQQSGDLNAQAEVAAYVNALLRALATISEDTQVPIELYNADGSSFGTYDPNLSGYVSR